MALGTTDPQKLAALKGKAAFSFEGAARRAQQEYPQETAAIAFYDADRNRAFYTQKVFDRTFASGTRNIAARVAHWLTRPHALYNLRRDAVTIGPHVALGRDILTKTPAHVLVYSTNSIEYQLRQRLPVLKDYDINVLHDFIFDHEMGHLTVPGGTKSYWHDKGDPHLAAAMPENIADAYGVLRSFARHGAAAETTLDHAAFIRAVEAVRGTASHPCLATMDKIILDAKSCDFSALTPRQTHAVAQAYARLFSPGPQALAAVRGTFDLVTRQVRPDNLHPLRHVAYSTVYRHADPVAVYSGARFLYEFLKPGGAETPLGRIELKDETWTRLAEDISIALARIPDNHMLRQLDLNKADILKRQKPPLNGIPAPVMQAMKNGG